LNSYTGKQEEQCMFLINLIYKSLISQQKNLYNSHFTYSFMKKKKKESRSDSSGGLVFVGALMIGIGLGIFYGNAAVGTLVGLGVGFVLFGLIKAFMKE
jgi:hypothetical protein